MIDTEVVYHGRFFQERDGYDYGVEKLANIRDEVVSLNRAQWGEVAEAAWQVGFNPDYDLMCFLETRQRFVVFTVRDGGGALVATAFFTMGPGLVTKGRIVASDVCIFVDKSVRKKGVAQTMMEFAVMTLQALKVDHIQLADYSESTGGSIERVIDPLGFTKVGSTYMLNTGG